MKTKEFHGLSKHPLYGRYNHMLARCYNPRDAAYKNYGGRGITVCDRWRESFAAYVADMGECPAGYSIDRIDNDGPYSPENCRWATRHEQNMNKRHQKPITHGGVTLPMKQWAERLGIDYSVLHKRISCSGMTFGEAIAYTQLHTHDGVTLSLKGWAERVGMNHGTLHYRVKYRGMSIGEAITAPVASKYYRRP